MPALEDAAARIDHRIHALFVAKQGPLLHAIERHLAAAAENGEHGGIVAEIERVIAPFAGGDHASVDIENLVQFAPVVTHLRRGKTAAPMSRPRG